jgi:toxin ParE1/3/4
MRQLHYTDEADHNLVEIAVYIATECSSRHVAEDFVERLRSKCRLLASLPATLGTARPELLPDIRSTPYQNYVIYFRYVGDTVEIVNILSASRDADALLSDTPTQN